MTQNFQVMLEGYIDVPPDRLDAVRDALPSHIALTRAEPGCLQFDVVEDQSVPGRFNVSERFQSMQDFDAHQARTESSPWARITDGIPRVYEITEVPA